MNKIHYLIPLILGLGLTSVAILPALAQQVTFAIGYGEKSSDELKATPSGVSQSNTSGTENMTALSENIPTANVTGAGEVPGTESIPLDTGNVLD